VAAAIIAAGFLTVNLAPPLPQLWIGQPDFSPDDGDDSASVVGRDDEVVVVLDHDRPALIGYDLEGNELWSNGAANSGGSRAGVFLATSVLTYPRSGNSGGISLVSTASGETEWSTEVGDAEPFSANDDVVVFADTDRTFALDRATGEPLWELDFEPTASSEGRTSYSPRRWTAHTDWVVVRDVDASELLVVNASTGDIVTGFPEDVFVTDWAIVADTLVTFGFEDTGQRFANGTALAGGEDWTTEIHDFHVGAFYEPVGSDLRIVADFHVEWIDGATGKATTLELPTGWQFANMSTGIDGARSLVAEQRESDGTVTGVGIFDSVSGDFTEIEGTVTRNPQVLGVTPTGTLVSLPYLDAVGGKHNRVVLVPDQQG
jgi:hypothetical protein